MLRIVVPVLLIGAGCQGLCPSGSYRGEDGSCVPLDTSADPGSDSDSASDSESDTGSALPPVAPYIVSIDHFASPSRLLKIDVATGTSVVACELPIDLDDVNYPTSTFSRAGTLYASNHRDKTLDVIDPCTCEVTPLGPTGYSTIPGITANRASGLFAIESEVDLLLELSTTTGAGTPVGALGLDFQTAGATWSDALDALYGIEGGTDMLYTIDPHTGAATPLVALNLPFDAVGMELNPSDGQIYACTNDAVLRRVDPVTGEVTEIGTGMGHVGPCNNLAAPWTRVACLEAL